MSVILLLVVLSLSVGARQTPAPAARVIASSAEWTITAADFELIVKTFPPQDRERYTDPDYRRPLVNELVRIWTLTTEARKKGVDVGVDYESRRNYYQQYAREIEVAISEEGIRSYYESHLDDFTQVRFSHILILNGNSPITPYANV